MGREKNKEEVNGNKISKLCKRSEGKHLEGTG